MHFIGQITLRKFSKGAGKRGFRRNLRPPLPTTDTAQWLVDAKTINESAGGGSAEHRLGDKGARQATPILLRTPSAAGRIRDEGFEADHIEKGDEPTEQLGHRLDFFAQPWQQGALNVSPTRPHGVKRISHHVTTIRLIQIAMIAK